MTSNQGGSTTHPASLEVKEKEVEINAQCKVLPKHRLTEAKRWHKVKFKTSRNMKVELHFANNDHPFEERGHPFEIPGERVLTVCQNASLGTEYYYDVKEGDCQGRQSEEGPPFVIGPQPRMIIQAG